MNYVNRRQEENEIQEKSKISQISVNEFDRISEVHQFSERYERRKKMLIKEYDNDSRKKVKRIPFRVTVAVATICIVATVGVYAAVTHENFLSGAFGNSSRESVTSHIFMQDNGDKGDVAVQMPEREYVAVDIETAEKIIGNYIMDKPITKKIGEHTLTILSAVRDKNAMIMEFTLERKGGENALVYDKVTNAAKGAYISENADIMFYFKNGADSIYVDIEKSTDEKLYCYEYVVFGKALEEGESPVLSITSADKPLSQLEDNEPRNEDTLTIPVTKVVPSVKFISEKGGRLEVSTLGLNIDMSKGLGLKGGSSKDPGNIKSIRINYNDGTEYVVCDDNVMNEGYACGFGSMYRSVFNRLVEIDKIETIEVNGVIYKVE